MGTALQLKESSFTPLDHDTEWLAGETIAEDTTVLRKRMASAALSLMDRAGVNLLDADFDVWSVGTPASQGLVDHRPIVPSQEQMAFTTTLESVRNIVANDPTRPLVVYTAMQRTSVPRDTILLNIVFYLSAHGLLVEFKVEKQDDGTYAVHVIVR